MTVAGTTLNLVLDYVFLFVLGFGVAGAAWSNVIGQSAAAIAFFSFCSRVGRVPVGPTA